MSSANYPVSISIELAKEIETILMAMCDQFAVMSEDAAGIRMQARVSALSERIAEAESNAGQGEDKK